MIARTVLRAAYDILSELESDNVEFEEFADGIINVLIGETFNLNNDLRIYKGKEPLTEYPLIKTLDDDIPYEPEVLITAMPYGICEKYVEPDGDPTRTGYFNSMFVNGINACQRGQLVQIEDVY